MPDSEHFDYIILGAGCAGLSLALRLIEAPELASKKILLIDKSPKQQNDRTWCFWEPPPTTANKSVGLNFFEHLVHHQWQQLWFKHPKGDMPLNIAPYNYKMVRAVDFYKYTTATVAAAKNITVAYDTITHIDAAAGIVQASQAKYSAEHIFSSVLRSEPTLAPHQLYLLQHFRGWWIDTDYDAFDPAAADLMNYHTSQQHGCTFVYVLPVSKRRALVEYTLFSEEVLTSEAYDEGLKTFIAEQLNIKSYHIAEIENGIIPMTDLQFRQQDGKVTFIGTAGGFTKASTGYTFQFIQRYTHQIVQQLIANQPIKLRVHPRFPFYDSVLLRVLHERRQLGANVFYDLFKRCRASRLLRFLDNQSSFADELRIMNSTKKSVFIAAAIRILLRRPNYQP